MARKASPNATLIRSLRDLLSLPPDGYQGILEEYKRLRLDVKESHEAQLYLAMQSFRLWMLMSSMGRNKLTEEECRTQLQEVLSALEGQDHNGYQRLRSKLRALNGPDGPETPALDFFAPRVAAFELPRFQKGDEIPKPDDILIGILYDFVVRPLAKELEAEDWQAQTLKESMAMKAALWAATESNTTKISREKKQKAAFGQVALWGLAFLMVAGMAFAGVKMGGFFGKSVDPGLALSEAKTAMKASNFEAAIEQGELALQLLQDRKGTPKDTKQVREFLVEAYAKNGQKDKSREVLLQLKNDFPKEKRYQKRLKELEARPPKKPASKKK